MAENEDETRQQDTADAEPGEFEDLLDYILQARGFDFTRYKRTSLTRRVNVRMQALDVVGYEDYRDYLEVHPEEFAHLFDSILINVTSFFRDAEAWDAIKSKVVPPIVESTDGKREIRVWSAGCSSGEEPYSAAMVLVEALGEERFKESVKIYATDIDEDALRKARSASYGEKDMESVSDERKERFFNFQKGSYVFKPDLRRVLVFGRHNLLADAPISKLDLLVCRNTLMYFNAEGQERALGIFGFALNPTGYLFLGKAEMLLTRTNLFRPTELKYRIFQRADGDLGGERYPAIVPPGRSYFHEASNLAVRFKNEVFEKASEPQIVLDEDARVVMSNQLAQNFFYITDLDEGMPFTDLRMSTAELYQAIKVAREGRHPTSVPEFTWRNKSGQDEYFNVRVNPLSDRNGEFLGLGLTFNRMTDSKLKEDELEHTKQELETAYEELQSSNEELQTTNEELQSSNEELETTNEELQSTNEELETMNEELQSTNEELQTTNDELRERTTELDDANSFLASILSGMKAGIVVVDPDMRVKSWNQRAQDLWGVLPQEAEGSLLFSLDIGLPVVQLNDSFRRVLRDIEAKETTDLDAVNRKGKKIKVKVSVSALKDTTNKTIGAIIIMEEQPAGK